MEKFDKKHRNTYKLRRFIANTLLVSGATCFVGGLASDILFANNQSQQSSEQVSSPANQNTQDVPSGPLNIEEKILFSGVVILVAGAAVKYTFNSVPPENLLSVDTVSKNDAEFESAIQRLVAGGYPDGPTNIPLN